MVVFLFQGIIFIYREIVARFSLSVVNFRVKVFLCKINWIHNLIDIILYFAE